MRHAYILALCLCAIIERSEPFSLPFFSGYNEDASTNSIQLHPLSPREADPQTFRVKRQAYQISVGGEVAVTVDKTGLGESGVFGPWSSDGQCTRSCGGGIQRETRACNGECTGPTVRYVSCNIEPCDEPTDFRAEQCAAHNDDPLDGRYYKWKPHAGKNKCELTCKPESAAFYYKWADKVVDGTRCDDDTSLSDSICVDGVCLPLGCDGKIGSDAKNDKCGVCNGNETTCKTISGTFDERNLSPGYHDIVVIPAGATAIRVEEKRPTKNNLAIKNSTGDFYLNGNYQIQVLDKDVIVVGGSAFKYDSATKGDGVTEKLTANGPLKEELTISLLFQAGSKNSAIKYEYSIPLEDDVQYIYKPGEWSGCSVTCGKGVITRTPYCTDTLTQQRVSDEVCDENNATKPEFEKPCQTVDCEAEWYIGEWEQCSQTCGDGGWQYRVVYCHKVFADGRRMTVSDGNCSAVERPEVKQTCSRFACPEWQAGPWSACSEKCGDARQYRSVTCRSQKEGEEAKLLPAESCDTEGKVENERNCNLGPCEGLNFVTSEWNLCLRCNDTEETRNVTCKDKTGRAYPLEKCLNDTITKIPDDTRTCATQAPCIYEWHSSQWSKCSTECGHGHKTRNAHCAINEMGEITIADESLCSGEKPSTKEECVNEEKCTGTYFSGPWNECSEKCNGGNQSRVVVCLNYDRKPVPEWCDEKEKPVEEQACNTDPCPTCEDSEFGCCPDNTTFAQGSFLEGCTNCSISDFGCCEDNVTEATGPNGKGCLEYIGSEEGSGEEAIETTPSEEETKCEVTDEKTGEAIQVPCSVTIPPQTIEGILGGEDENGTMAQNITKHCSKTEFGCCPDWYTPAEGTDYAGCPEFTLGACNETKHGCCPDNVTLARGPNMEGCGEPSCAASRFGCCKDRKTIAFGSHYAGCERSSFPCELSTYGCCPDGETAALGKNMTGCGANCLVTKYGCCPDGVTTAKGTSNEGCGCEFAQYGCCPDGKSAAKGAGYYGCPDTCAQSQYGCCPDGKTPSRGPNKEGCPCQYTRWGCCSDGETTALGPRNDGCDDCRYAKYGCCADGESKALGPDFAGCPTTTAPPHIVGGTVAPAKIVACNLPQDQGQVCHPGYKLVWFYDTAEGRCSQFWFGGCSGNENNFASKELCEQICVEPPNLGRCYLPKIEGPQRCSQLVARYWYDYTTKQCAAFWWRGCLGNSNNFGSWEDCMNQCSTVGPLDVDLGARQASPYRPPAQQAPAGYWPQPQQTQPPQQQQRLPEPMSPVQPAPSQELAPAVRLSPFVGHPATHPPTAPQYPDYSAVSQWSDSCRQNVDSGTCKDYVDQYYFDAFSGKCYTFIYSGCGGNSNRYATEAECLQKCGHLKPDITARERVRTRPPVALPREPITTTPAPQRQTPIPPRRKVERTKSREICNLRLDVGRCEGHFDSWYYEVATGVCEQFQYSGCGGNANRFHSKEQCEGLCMHGAPARLGPSSFAPQPQAEPQQGIVGNILDKAESAKNAVANALGLGASFCEAPKDTGPCNRFVTKWYYNKGDGTCNRFHYGGCEGNGNRFETEQECKDKCGDYTDTCFLPKVVGPCAGKNERYYYDQSSRQCAKFEYSGCLGNNNNFRFVQDCEARCLPPSSVALAAPSLQSFSSGNHLDAFDFTNFDAERTVNSRPVRQQALSLVPFTINDPVPSNSRRSIPTYYAEEIQDNEASSRFAGMASNSVQSVFNANGNEANEVANIYDENNDVSPMPSVHESVGINNFSEVNEYDEDEGMATVFPHDPHALPELCALPEERGSCFGSHLRWFYDSEIGRCSSFMYSGCGNNANHFTSLETCERACGEYREQRVCELSHDAGNCTTTDHAIATTVLVSKWFFDHRLGQCHVFMWSGCGGNGNRFSSKSECENLCRSEALEQPDDSVCSLVRDSGPCFDQVTLWYFDSPVQECRKFTYGGCRGNGNRFNTKDECKKRCKSPASSQTGNTDSKQICSMSFESGPCRGTYKRYFFDANVGHCKMFSYGGCEGNANRFKTEVECYSTCKVFANQSSDNSSKLHQPHHYQRAHVETQPGPFTAESTIQLRCIADSENDASEPTWYLNEVEIDFRDLTTSSRLNLSKNGQFLVIPNAKPKHNGDYSCAIGSLGMISKPYSLVVQELPLSIHCTDKGSHSTCSLIKKTGLCSNLRYGKFCCRTCTNTSPAA